VVQEPADAAVTIAPALAAHAAAPGVAAALVAVAEEVMVSVHIEPPSLSGGEIDISKPYRNRKTFRYV
jgi:hypothetical protein